ncbi:MAG: TonB-dependent receptor [Novosphingobium sp.]
MRHIGKLAFASASLLAFATPVYAQDAASDSGKSDADIVVSARRQDERLIDVPKSVSVVNADTLNKLKIRQFGDIQSVVPGLSLLEAPTGYTQKTTMRGADFDVNSGADATVDFYLNDASIQQGYLFRSLYDIGQIEVLKGPQGTLRGRATPSGSITFTTHQPDLNEYGGYADGTIGSENTGWNLQGAVNVPIVKDVLAIRVAGVVDHNKGNGVENVWSPTEHPFQHTWSGRVSVRFEPTSDLQFNVTYQHMVEDFRSYDQTQSACLFDGGGACDPTYPLVTAEDRLSTVNGARTFHEVFDIINGRADWHFAGQKLSYVGQYAKGKFLAVTPLDLAAIYAPYAITPLQDTYSTNEYQSHELRLSSENRIAGIFDYTVGFFYIDTPTSNAIVYPGTTPTYVLNYGDRKEASIFGNITAHVTDKLEISAGIRHMLKATNESYLLLGGSDLNGTGATMVPSPTLSIHPTIWSASASYHFTPDFMVYASAGTSFRQGLQSVGPVLTPSQYGAGLLAGSSIFQYVNTKSEYSHSYEVGIKTEFADHRGTFNISYFHQNFSNFLFANAATNWIVGYGSYGYDSDLANALPIQVSGLVANVPVKIDGIEADASFRFSPNFNIGGSLSYVNSRITGGTIACNPVNIAGATPTVAEIEAASQGGNGDVAQCDAKGRPASFSPKFTASVRAEYNHRLDGTKDAYLRGQLSYYGATPLNTDVPFNKQDPYVLLNLYLGARDTSGRWDLSFFVKNVTNTKAILAANGGNVIQATGTTASPYATIGYTQPREAGLNLRVAFGSK